MTIEAQFPTGEWIRMTGMQMYINGSAASGYPALDALENVYGRSLRDYAQRLFLGVGQDFSSVNDFMPRGKTTDYPDRYEIDGHILVVERKKGKIKIGVESRKRKLFSPEPDKIPVAEVLYEIVRAEKLKR